MFLTDNEITKLTDKHVCPLCKHVTRQEEVISHYNHITGLLCVECKYVIVPITKQAFDRFIPPGIFFDTVH